MEPARPLTEAEKERAFIIDNKIFDLHPHNGSLQPGETQQVSQITSGMPGYEGFKQSLLHSWFLAAGAAVYVGSVNRLLLLHHTGVLHF